MTKKEAEQFLELERRVKEAAITIMELATEAQALAFGVVKVQSQLKDLAESLGAAKRTKAAGLSFQVLNEPTDEPDDVPADDGAPRATVAEDMEAHAEFVEHSRGQSCSNMECSNQGTHVFASGDFLFWVCDDHDHRTKDKGAPPIVHGAGIRVGECNADPVRGGCDCCKRTGYVSEAIGGIELGQPCHCLEGLR